MPLFPFFANFSTSRKSLKFLHFRPPTRSKENFRKRSEISVSRTQKSDPLTRSKIEDFDAILAYLGYLAEDFGSQPTKIFSTETLRVYLRVKIFFRGKTFSSSLQEEKEENAFLLARRKFSSREKKIFQEILLYGQIKPGNGDSFSFRKILVRGLIVK